MLGQHDARLHHVKIVDSGGIDAGQRRGEKIRLFLIVAFKADAVERPDHSLEQRDRLIARNELALRKRRARGDPLAPRRPSGVPLPHSPALLQRL